MRKFNYEKNGYNRQEVNEFIDEVISNTEDIINSCKRQREEINKLKKEVDYYRKNGNNNYNYDLEAATSIRNSALRDAEEIVNTAKNDASIILNEALLKAEETEVRTHKIEESIGVFKKKLEVLLKEQEAIVDEIETLDIENN